MTVPTSTSGFPVPLTSKAWNRAQQYGRPQFDAVHNQQLFRNGLAVFAVDFYLTCMAFETDRDIDPISSQLLDGADLSVKNIGMLECCPIQTGDTTFQVPVDAWCDRIAYVIVQVDEDFKQAHIMGFNPQPIPPSGIITLQHLKPIEELPQYLYDSQTTALAQVWSWAKEQGLAISDAIGSFHGWQLDSDSLTFATRTAHAPAQPPSAVEDSALIAKTVQLQDLELTLVMGLSAKTEGHFRVELIVESEYPLPPGLQLAIVDEAGQTFQQASEDLTVHPFSAAPNEHFSVVLRYGEAQHLENFII